VGSPVRAAGIFTGQISLPARARGRDVACRQTRSPVHAPVFTHPGWIAKQEVGTSVASGSGQAWVGNLSCSPCAVGNLRFRERIRRCFVSEYRRRRVSLRCWRTFEVIPADRSDFGRAHGDVSVYRSLRLSLKASMKSTNCERGQAMVELALLLVVLLAALIGIIDWSWTMFTQESLVSRASMAARSGAVHLFTSWAVQDLVLYGVTPCSGCTAAFGLTSANVSVNLVPATYTPEDNGQNITTCQIVVTISGYTVNHFTPVFNSSITGRPITASCPRQRKVRQPRRPAAPTTG